MEHTSNILHIALAADNNYVMPTTVVIQSIFDNNANCDIQIYMLYLEDTLSKDELAFMASEVQKHGGVLTSLEVKNEQIEGFPSTRHGKATLLRLCLPELLPHINKILYLDGDIIVDGDISYLYNIDITDFLAAATRDSASVYNIGYQTSMGINSSHFYFNAGVMLLNLEAFRKIDLAQEMNQFVRRNYHLISAPDQDFLNYICQGKTLYFPPKYNLNFAVEKDIMCQMASADEIKEAKKKPIIVHYIGKVKPWSTLSTHPKRSLWWKYLKRTKFADYQPTDANMRNYLRKSYLLIFKSIECQFTLESKRRLGRFIPSNLKNKFKKSLIKPI